MRRLAVFLASSSGHDPAHAELAAGVGAELARRGSVSSTAVAAGG